MANPRQRRKTRSSSYKAVHHSRQAKKILKKQPAIRGPKLLHDAWDKHKTVRQNYAALGLSTSLNPRTSGGVEFNRARREEPQDSDTRRTSPELPGRRDEASRAPIGFGRIIRDEHGNAIDVELEESNDDSRDPQEESLIEDRVSAVNHEAVSWVTLGRDPRHVHKETEVVQALETVSSSTQAVSRFASANEIAYLRRLIAKYNDNVDAMARDRRLNPDQRTAGEISRAIRKAGRWLFGPVRARRTNSLNLISLSAGENSMLTMVRQMTDQGISGA